MPDTKLYLVDIRGDRNEGHAIVRAHDHDQAAELAEAAPLGTPVEAGATFELSDDDTPKVIYTFRQAR